MIRKATSVCMMFVDTSFVIAKLLEAIHYKNNNEHVVHLTLLETAIYINIITCNTNNTHYNMCGVYCNDNAWHLLDAYFDNLYCFQNDVTIRL